MHPSTCRPPRGPRQPPAAPCPPRPPSRGSPPSCPMGWRLTASSAGTRRLSGESGTAAGEDYDITRISWEHCVISGDERRLCAHQLQISAELTLSLLTWPAWWVWTSGDGEAKANWMCASSVHVHSICSTHGIQQWQWTDHTVQSLLQMSDH